MFSCKCVIAVNASVGLDRVQENRSTSGHVAMQYRYVCGCACNFTYVSEYFILKSFDLCSFRLLHDADIKHSSQTQ